MCSTLIYHQQYKIFVIDKYNKCNKNRDANCFHLRNAKDFGDWPDDRLSTRTGFWVEGTPCSFLNSKSALELIRTIDTMRVTSLVFVRNNPCLMKNKPALCCLLSNEMPCHLVGMQIRYAIRDPCAVWKWQRPDYLILFGFLRHTA